MPVFLRFPRQKNLSNRRGVRGDSTRRADGQGRLRLAASRIREVIDRKKAHDGDIGQPFLPSLLVKKKRGIPFRVNKNE